MYVTPTEQILLAPFFLLQDAKSIKKPEKGGIATGADILEQEERWQRSDVKWPRWQAKYKQSYIQDIKISN